MAEIYLSRIVQRIYDSPSSEGLRKLAQAKAQVSFLDAVEELKADFEASTVTQELDRGIGAPNISETLRGGDAPQNLYSFIGFPAGTKPTEEIRDRLDPSHRDGPHLRYRGKERRGTSIRYQFIVSEPDREAIWKATPIPWAPGMSWARKIEGIIPGFAAFIDRFTGFPPSRSGGGFQAKNPNGSVREVRTGEYQEPAGGYIQTMFRRFLKHLSPKGGSQ